MLIQTEIELLLQLLGGLPQQHLILTRREDDILEEKLHDVPQELTVLLDFRYGTEIAHSGRRRCGALGGNKLAVVYGINFLYSSGNFIIKSFLIKLITLMMPHNNGEILRDPNLIQFGAVITTVDTR